MLLAMGRCASRAIRPFTATVGFVPATSLGLRYDGDEDGMMTPYFLCKELIPGYLKDAHGLYKVADGLFCDR